MTLVQRIRSFKLSIAITLIDEELTDPHHSPFVEFPQCSKSGFETGGDREVESITDDIPAMLWRTPNIRQRGYSVELLPPSSIAGKTSRMRSLSSESGRM